MGMHFVAGTGAEVDDAQIEILACLRRQQRLPRHGTTREQRSVHGLGRDFGWFVYLHWSILLSGYRAYLASRGSVPASQCPCNGASGHGQMGLFQQPARAARFCASRASQASAIASTTLAHSSTGTSIMRPSRGTAAVPAATASAKTSRTRLLCATRSAVGVKAELTGATQLGSGQRTPFMPRFLASVAIR